MQLNQPRLFQEFMTDLNPDDIERAINIAMYLRSETATQLPTTSDLEKKQTDFENAVDKAVVNLSQQISETGHSGDCSLAIHQHAHPVIRGALSSDCFFGLCQVIFDRLSKNDLH